jgi:RES domain-containing protein
MYPAESPAGALVEALVHVQAAYASERPKNRQLPEVALPDDASGDGATPKLGRSWRDQPATTLALGDAWLAERSSLLLRVPSAVVGRSFNRLFNPPHAQAASARLLSVAPYPFDERLLRRR